MSNFSEKKKLRNNAIGFQNSEAIRRTRKLKGRPHENLISFIGADG
jgi:hypothetical protein